MTRNGTVRYTVKLVLWAAAIKYGVGELRRYTLFALIAKTPLHRASATVSSATVLEALASAAPTAIVASISKTTLLHSLFCHHFDIWTMVEYVARWIRSRSFALCAGSCRRGDLSCE